MGLKTITSDLVDELYKSHNGLSEMGFNFGTGRNNKQCGINSKVGLCIHQCSKVIFENLTNLEIEIDLDKFKDLVRQSVIDLFTEGKFINESCSVRDNIALLRSDIDIKLKMLQKNYTHHFAAKTVGLESIEIITIGPVSIMTREQWIQTVEFRDWVKERYLGQKQENFQWKEILLEALKNKECKLEGLAADIYPAIEECEALVSVDVSGKEIKLSKKFAQIMARTALDMISLLLGGQRFFFQQVLNDERLGPTMSYSLSSNDGFLNLPGMALGNQCVPVFPNFEAQKQGLEILNKFIPKFSHILNNLEKKSEESHPILAMKWVFALNWYAEGMRETNDSIALAKLASCLDTLSSNGRRRGITELLCNVYGHEKDSTLFEDAVNGPITVSMFVAQFYDDGRSRILHGTLENMLESFEIDRKRLARVAREVLVEFANRLYVYQGEDNDKAFRTMKYDA